EDGIRDKLVTGVQTCALPIFNVIDKNDQHVAGLTAQDFQLTVSSQSITSTLAPPADTPRVLILIDSSFFMRNHSHDQPATVAGRSEERRVGKESRSGRRRERE